jgi:uncharacterized membrane protein HdeD (DUF308 family)
MVMNEEKGISTEQVHAVVSGLHTSIVDKLSSIWWAFLVRGIFAIALGIFALFWPSLSLNVLLLSVGFYLMADGAVGLVGSLRYPELRENLARALIFLGIGAILIFWPGATLRMLLILFGVASVVTGVSQILDARRLPLDESGRGAAMMIGGAAIIVGLVLALWPGSGLTAISWIIGIAAILIGAFLVFLGSRFKHLRVRVETLANKNAGANLER